MPRFMPSRLSGRGIHPPPDSLVRKVTAYDSDDEGCYTNGNGNNVIPFQTLRLAGLLRPRITVRLVTARAAPAVVAVVPITASIATLGGVIPVPRRAVGTTHRLAPPCEPILEGKYRKRRVGGLALVYYEVVDPSHDGGLGEGQQHHALGSCLGMCEVVRVGAHALIVRLFGILATPIPAGHFAQTYGGRIRIVGEIRSEKGKFWGVGLGSRPTGCEGDQDGNGDDGGGKGVEGPSGA